MNPAVQATTVKELIALAKERPRQLNFASSGTSSSLRFAGELMQSMAGIEMVHVPYKGTGPATNAVMSGEVQLMFGNPIVAAPQVKAGRLRALAMTGRRRVANLPDVPTMAEAGLPGYLAGSWFGLMAPGRTSPAIVSKLHVEVARIVRLPEVKSLMHGVGAEAIGNTPQEFTDYIRTETVKWTKIIRASGITPD